MLNDLQLPLSNPNEDLETISRHRFLAAFDPKRFEVRPEIQRDKGIDFIVELKSEGCYTNYRFAVQLKSTASSSINNDGSISYPIETSNLRYLLNYPMIAYYVLYDHQQDKFYYEQAWEAYSSLRAKYNAQKLPATYNIRFHKNLNENTLSEIFEINLKNGDILRQLHPHLGANRLDGKQSSGIIIDKDNNVYTIEENIAYLNHFGYYLINIAAFDIIIEIEQRCHPRKNTTPRFSLICGIAYYFKGNQMYQALNLLTKAQKGILELEPEMGAYLNVIILYAKKQIGSLSEEDFEKETDEVLQNEKIGSFLEIERAWRKFQNINESIPNQLSTLYKDLEAIIDNEPNNHRIRTLSYARIQDAETGLAIYHLTLAVHHSICTGAKNGVRSLRQKWEMLAMNFDSRVVRFHDFTFKIGDFQIAGNLALSRIRMDYSAAYIFGFYENWDFHTMSSEPQITNPERQLLEKHCGFLWDSAIFLESAGFIEIYMQSLLLRYQLLDLLKEQNLFKKTEERIRAAMTKYEIESHRKQFEDLITNGMDHEQFFWDSTQRIVNFSQIAENKDLEKPIFKRGQDNNPMIDPNFKWVIEQPREFFFPEIQITEND